MKTSVYTHTFAFLVLGLMVPLSAQDMASIPNPSESTLKTGICPVLPGSYDVPALEKAEGVPAAEQPQGVSQDASTLEIKVNAARNVDSVVDLGVLRNPSPYRKVMVSAQTKPGEVSADGLQSSLAQISAVYRESGKPEKSTDCQPIALSVEQRVKLDPSGILEIVEREIGANPTCSCEIVKTAIKASEANVTQVVAIVEAAIHASPESMRIISQCAIAAMPDSISAVQALLAKLDPNAGESGYSVKSAKSAKSAKSPKDAQAPMIPDPLDRPYFPIIPPPPIDPPDVTEVDPCP